MTLHERLAASLRALQVDPHEEIGVACSGGADSVALLQLLVRSGRPVVCLHVDHGLRPDSSLDADFVVGLAEGLGAPVWVERVEVGSDPSVEAAARLARYDALGRMADAAGLRHVATAHTLDDQAETVLLRSMRGGSLDAIAPRRGRFVRPLLDVRRQELREWLGANALVWREDPTNADLRRERNWVRHVLMPQVRERRIGVDAALARVASRQRVDREALDALAAEVFERARTDDVGVLLDATDVDPLPQAIAARVVRSALRAVGEEPSGTDLERVLSMRSGLRSGPTSGIMRARRLSVGRATVWRLDGAVAFLRPALPLPAVVLPSGGLVVDEGRGLRVRVGSRAAAGAAWRWRVTVPEPASVLELRSRRDGDRVRRAGGTRKVQDVLVDAKVPRPLRDLVGIVASERGALAVVPFARPPLPSDGPGSQTVIDVEPVGGSWAREMLWASV